ncbi:hypothetical protein VM1G_04198 [Cytospora mali]|uniref:Uncharacterized protein n=1 Tax=Cytospora mali TaxID=578113 RepID=A0A194VZ52_CYTMA|nr:hypothetical protein VM1G_04198 [Valsa mali]
MYSTPATNGYHSTPYPSMEARMEGISSGSVKRGPEDDIQFVSSKPVKKARASRESPSSQAQQGSGQATNAPLPSDRPTGGNTGVGLGLSEPQPEPNMLSRGTSLPSMENYVFPQPGPAMASRSSRSSPMLSPKQLPLSLFPSFPAAQAPSGISTSGSEFGNPMQQRNFVTHWQVSGMPLQHMNTHPEVKTNQSMPLQSFQKLGIEPTGVVQNEEQSSPSRPDTPRHPKVVPGPVAQPMEPHAEEAQKDRPDTPHMTTEPMRSTQPFMAQATWPPSQPTTQSPRPMIQPQFQTHHEAGNSNNYVMPGAQSIAPKAPCLACEQIRQQAFLNKTNGYQAVHYPHVHHGWHGPGMPHSHPTHTPPTPMSNPGFAMGSNINNNQQHRFQHVPTGHIATNYAFTQVPGQVPVHMTMQRVPMANMTAGNEAFPGAPQSTMSHQNAMATAAPMGPSAAQVAHHQYVQNHFSPSQPPATAPKPTAAQPPPPSPRTPRMPTPPPPQTHSPNLIVDIAETCEELFPWDQVAERHGVSRQKVVETFAAIVQLPLLRCSTDKKRHGRLATNRLKDYTRAKNAAKTSSPSSAASSSSSSSPSSKQQSDAANSTEDRPVLPGVLELAKSMSPLGLPSTLTNRFPGPW